MDLIRAISDHPVFLLISGLASIFGLFIGGRAIYKKRTIIKTENAVTRKASDMLIEGNHNDQALGNIDKTAQKESGYDTVVKVEKNSLKTEVGDMTIKGSGNKQAGGDINE